MILDILEVVVSIQTFEVAKGLDLPPNDNAVQHAAPDSRNS